MKRYWFIFISHDTFYDGDNLAQAVVKLVQDLPNFPMRKIDKLMRIEEEYSVEQKKRRIL